MTTKAKKRAMKKYETTQEKIELLFESGKKEEYRKKATSRGMSLTQFICYLIEEDIKRG